MSQSKIYEGTFEEIATRYGRLLANRHVKVVVEGADNEATLSQPFYETATLEEWSRALQQWAASHDSSTPLLSDEAVERDSIYEGRGE